ncbi:unnamed protein product, partial [Protopolystoma xenopodis]
MLSPAEGDFDPTGSHIFGRYRSAWVLGLPDEGSVILFFFPLVSVTPSRAICLLHSTSSSLGPPGLGFPDPRTEHVLPHRRLLRRQLVKLNRPVYCTCLSRNLTKLGHLLSSLAATISIVNSTRSSADSGVSDA